LACGVPVSSPHFAPIAIQRAHETRKSNRCGAGTVFAGIGFQIIRSQFSITFHKMGIEYHSVIPLGQDELLLRPGNRALYFLASAESIAFEGWRAVIEEEHLSLQAADGSPVQQYPRFIDFRVTVSARPKAIAALQPLPVGYPGALDDVNDFLLNLQYRVKIFHALRVKVVQPRLVKLIGVPTQVPYDECIYRVCFDLGEVPVGDRIVLEVLSPDGERLTKFHLDM
jgi:hypothetical protein